MIAYERFDAWHAAHHLALELYRDTDTWPRSERFGLTIQMRRAALSVPTNIAEVAAKRGSREFRRFLDIALGSLAELSYLLRFSRDYGLLTEESWLALEADRDRAGRLTWGLYHAVSNATENEPMATRPPPDRPTAGQSSDTGSRSITIRVFPARGSRRAA